MPYNRAKVLVMSGKAFACFEMSWSEELVGKVVFASEPIYSTTSVVFARASETGKYERASKLRRGTSVGTVFGYEYPEAFVRLVRSGTLAPDPSPSEAQSLKKLVYGRIDLAIANVDALKSAISCCAGGRRGQSQGGVRPRRFGNLYRLLRRERRDAGGDKGLRRGHGGDTRRRQPGQDPRLLEGQAMTRSRAGGRPRYAKGRPSRRRHRLRPDELLRRDLFFTARADTLSGARIAAEESLARLQRELDLPLWNLDVETCKRIALGELNDPAVTAVLIRDIASGITFGVAESSASGKRIDVDTPTAAFLEDSAPIMVSGAVEHAMRVIGAAIVLADPRPALGTLLSGVLVATALAFLVGAAISASL